MTLYEFNLLSKNERYSTTWDKGVHIDTIVHEKSTIILYAVERFFVEIFYDQETNKIIDLKSFKQGESLNKYSGSLNL